MRAEANIARRPEQRRKKNTRRRKGLKMEKGEEREDVRAGCGHGRAQVDQNIYRPLYRGGSCDEQKTRNTGKKAR